MRIITQSYHCPSSSRRTRLKERCRTLPEFLLKSRGRGEPIKVRVAPLEAKAMIRLLAQWLLSALSLMIVAKLLPGFRINDFGTALAVAGVYGVLQVVLYPVLKFLAFLPMLLSFGLFAFVINAFLLFVTSTLVDSFKIATLPTALLGAVALTICNGLWRVLLF